MGIKKIDVTVDDVKSIGLIKDSNSLSKFEESGDLDIEPKMAGMRILMTNESKNQVNISYALDLQDEPKPSVKPHVSMMSPSTKEKSKKRMQQILQSDYITTNRDPKQFSMFCMDNLKICGLK